MAREFSIAIVSDREFDNIVSSDERYENARDSLGFADPGTGKAYVRQTYVEPLNKYLVAHEFNHLLSPDEGADMDEHGVYHKKFFKEVVVPAAATIVGTALGGPGLGGVVGGALGGGAGAAASGALTGKTRGLGKRVLKGAGIGALTGVARNILTPSATGGATGKGPLLPDILTGIHETPSGIAEFGVKALEPWGGLTSSMGAAQSLGGVASTLARGSLTAGTGASAVGGGNLLQKLLGGIKGIASTPPAAAGASLGPLLNMFQQPIMQSAGIGAGIAGIGQAAAPRVQVPDLRQLPGVQQFETDVKSLLGPISSEAANLSNIRLPAEVESRIRRGFEEQRARETSRFKMFQPGANVETSSEFREQMRDLSQREVEALEQARLQYMAEERQNLMVRLGITEDQLASLQYLAQLDISQIMAQTGIDAESAAQIKQIFGELGSTVATAGAMSQFGAV